MMVGLSLGGTLRYPWRSQSRRHSEMPQLVQGLPDGLREQGEPLQGLSTPLAPNPKLQYFSVANSP